MTSQILTVCKRYILPFLFLLFPIIAYQNCGLGIPKLANDTNGGPSFNGVGGLDDIIASQDWDISSHGRLYLTVDNELLCHDEKGQLLKQQTLDVRQNDGTLVASNRSGDTIAVVARLYKTPGDVASKTFFLWILGEDCTVLQAPIEFEGVHEYRSLAIDKDGSVAFAYIDSNNDVKLAIVSRSGIATTLNVFADRVGSSSTSATLSVDNDSGNGVIVRQDGATNPLYFQRFTMAGTLTDANSVEVQGSANHGGSVQTSMVGVNVGGAFAIYWADFADDSFHVNFYDSAATFVQHHSISGPTTQLATVFGDLKSHKLTLRTRGNYFLLPGEWDNNGSHSISLYREDGSLAKIFSLGSTSDTRLLGVDGQNRIYFKYQNDKLGSVK